MPHEADSNNGMAVHMDPHASGLTAVDNRSICQSILHWSIRSPDIVAFNYYPNRYTYRQLAFHVVQLANALQADGVRPGMIVAIEFPGRYGHLLFTLACQVIGATSISVEPEDLTQQGTLAQHCDVVLSTAPFPGMEGKTIPISRRYLESATSRIPSDLSVLDKSPPDEFVERITKSSGTTGQKKYMPWTSGLTRAALALRLKMFELAERDCHFCIFYNLSLRAAYLDICTSILLGRTATFSGWSPDGEILPPQHPDADLHGTMSFGDVSILEKKQHAPVERKKISLAIIAGRVSEESLRVLTRFTSGRIVVQYGSQEAFVVSVVGPDGVGELIPGMRARIVSENGEELGLMREGAIEIQGPALVSGYLWNPQANEQQFVDGWFRTLDYGYIPAPGKLVVLGRTDGLLNIGGEKIAPAPLEAQIEKLEGVSGAVLFSVPDKYQIERLHVVVEIDENAATDRENLTALREKIGPILVAHVHRYEIHSVQKMPRTDLGKIRKGDLRKIVFGTPS